MSPVNSSGIRTYTVAPTGQVAGTATKPSAVAVNVDPALIAAVVKRNSVSSGAELLNFSVAREQRATGPRVLAFVRDVAVTEPQETEYRVFLDRPDLTPQVPVTDPNYVGSFGVLVHGEHGGHGGQSDDNSNPSFVLDLTSAMQRVYANAQPPDGRVKLQFLPAPSGPNSALVGTIRPGRVEIAFVNV